jgi:hypothetical protein
MVHLHQKHILVAYYHVIIIIIVKSGLFHYYFRKNQYRTFIIKYTILLIIRNIKMIYQMRRSIKFYKDGKLNQVERFQ